MLHPVLADETQTLTHKKQTLLIILKYSSCLWLSKIYIKIGGGGAESQATGIAGNCEQLQVVLPQSLNKVNHTFKRTPKILFGVLGVTGNYRKDLESIPSNRKKRLDPSSHCYQRSEIGHHI